MCSGFWVKGFKAKVDQDKSRLYLKIASSLVLTNSWPQEALGNTEPSQHSTGSSLSYTSTMLESRTVGHVFKRSQKLHMYNVLILILATNFFFPKGVGNSGNEISTAMCLNQPSVSAGFYFSPRVGSAVGTERNLIHVG